jgi:hypothetical protein
LVVLLLTSLAKEVEEVESDSDEFYSNDSSDEFVSAEAPSHDEESEEVIIFNTSDNKVRSLLLNQ